MGSPSDDKSPMLQEVLTYYNQKLIQHGPTARGVDWSSSDRQRLVFEQITKICCSPRSGVRDTDFTLMDYGCGHGSLLGYLIEERWPFKKYIGFDLLPDMLEAARDLYRDHLDVTDFAGQDTLLQPADYVVASGLITVKTKADFSAWQDYVLETVEKMWHLAKKGIAFNSLTKYSDQPKMQDHLYYADPCFLFDYCKTRLSRNVALLHDYGLYEFTILVRRDDCIW
jgi:SAM-dependent methyltransferase